jgi:hypothetical protein
MLLCHPLMPPKPHPQPPTKEKLANTGPELEAVAPGPPQSSCTPSASRNFAKILPRISRISRISRIGNCKGAGSFIREIREIRGSTLLGCGFVAPCPVVPDQASIVLKRAKTRYFFAALPCHDPQLLATGSRLQPKGDAPWTEDSAGGTPTGATEDGRAPQKIAHDWGGLPCSAANHGASTLQRNHLAFPRIRPILSGGKSSRLPAP